ncbi:unnamed protein product, partial [Ectocarpus sp. 13 AM-2016]
VGTAARREHTSRWAGCCMATEMSTNVATTAQKPRMHPRPTSIEVSIALTPASPPPSQLFYAHVLYTSWRCRTPLTLCCAHRFTCACKGLLLMTNNDDQPGGRRC